MPSTQLASHSVEESHSLINSTALHAQSIPKHNVVSVLFKYLWTETCQPKHTFLPNGTLKVRIACTDGALWPQQISPFPPLALCLFIRRGCFFSHLCINFISSPIHCGMQSASSFVCGGQQPQGQPTPLL